MGFNSAFKGLTIERSYTRKNAAFLGGGRWVGGGVRFGQMCIVCQCRSKALGTLQMLNKYIII